MNQFEKLKTEIEEIKSDIFDPIYDILSAAEEDADKFYSKGVRSAGNRLKKKMQEIRKAIKHPVIKSKMTAIQNSAKTLRENLIEESKNK